MNNIGLVRELRAGDYVAHMRMRGPCFKVIEVHKIEHHDIYRVDLGPIAGAWHWEGDMTVVLGEPPK